MALPRHVKRQLQELYLRHRHANQIRTRILSEILTAYHLTYTNFAQIDRAIEELVAF